MAKKTPQLYASGRWRVSTPYKLDNSAYYTCQAIRSLEALVSEGIDPFDAFYAPVGITRDVYNVDRVNRPNIITLMSDQAPTLEVPDTYITSYPDLNTVNYRQVVLSVSLGALSDMISLEDLREKMGSLVMNTIGIKGTVQFHQVGFIDKTLSVEEHQVVEANRRSAVVNNTTDYAKSLRLEDKVAQLEERNALLEEILRDNGLIR